MFTWLMIFRDTLPSNYTCLREWKLLSLYTFHWIIFVLLIVSSLSRNFNHCAACFQSYINIACRSTQNDVHKYQTLLKITHNKTINKEKWNLNIINSLSCWSVTLLMFISLQDSRDWKFGVCQNWEHVQLAV